MARAPIDRPLGSERPEWTDTPSGHAARLRKEFGAFKKFSEKWLREAAETVRLYLDRRNAGEEKTFKVNLFTSSTQTQEALLYGQTPKVSVERRWSDFEDNGARVGATILGRLLNTDIARPSDGYAAALEYALSDRLKPGLGVVRLRYAVEFDTEHKDAITRPCSACMGSGQAAAEDGEPATCAGCEGTGQVELAPAVDREFKTKEDVETDYYHWRRFRWSPCRTWHEMRWVAFGADMTREQLVEKFGEKLGNRIPMRRAEKTRDGETDALGADPWSRAEVWEVWDKERRCVWWWAEGMERVLTPVDVDVNPNGSVPDPLELEGFWPMPRPLIANATTDAFLPRSDYAIAQDLYRSVNELSTRIQNLRKALKVVGLYDKSNEAVGRLLNEAQENQMIACDKWSLFAEKGGLKGAVDFFPVEMVAATLDKLIVQRQEDKQLLYEVTGLGDIMRGQQQAGQTATTSALEAKFGSIRMQRRQDEFARFASEAQQIRAEMICKLCDDETIIERSNVMRTPDAALIKQEQIATAQAKALGMDPPTDGPIACLRSQFMAYRIEVKPESVSLTDYNALKQERTEVLAAIAQFLQIAQPMMMEFPPSAPGLFGLLQWLVAGVKGGSQIETQLNQMAALAQQAASQPKGPPPPDPKLQATTVKAQAEIGKAHLGLVQAKVDTQAHIAKTQMDMQAKQQEHAMDLESTEAGVRANALKTVAALTAPRIGV